MTANTVSPTVAFTKMVRAYQTGGVSYEEFLASVSEQLTAGASKDDLLSVLQRREYVEPLPPHIHDVVVALISADDSLTDLPPPVEAVSINPSEAVAPDDVPANPVGVGSILSQRFQLMELLGTGRASRVFKAVDARRNPGTRNPFVAVKVFDDLPGLDAKAWAVLKQRVLKLQALTQGNIVRTLGCYAAEAAVFITMEYVAGTNLETRLERKPDPGAPPDRGMATSLILAVANAIEYAHSRDVVHGNVTASRVLIGDTGQVKVIGFGIDRGSLSNRPEAAPGMQFTDDIHALAALSYQLLVGRPPFAAEAGPQSRNSLPPPDRDLSPQEYTALSRALQPDPRGRPPTVAEFIDELLSPAPPPARKGVWFSLAAVALVLLGIAVLLKYPATRTEQPTVPPVAATPEVSLPAPVPAPVAVPAPARSTLPVRDCPGCPLLTFVPAGSFTQGAATSDASASASEKPRHPVVLDRPFAMTTNTVTVDQFRAFVKASHRDMRGCETYDGRWRHQARASFASPGFAQKGSHPATCISWQDASAYATWLSGESGFKYRLPSAAEWEYAARAGQDAVAPWTAGSDACVHANVADQSAARRYPGWEVFPCNDAYVYTAPVGSFAANGFGLNDMLGNVYEWQQECWMTTYEGAPHDASVRPGGDCTEHELRGGSWFSTPPFVRASSRNHFAAAYRTSTVGFRLVREMNP